MGLKAWWKAFNEPVPVPEKPLPSKCPECGGGLINVGNAQNGSMDFDWTASTLWGCWECRRVYWAKPGER